MAMDIAHRDHLLAALLGLKAVAVLLLCLLAEVLVFAMRLRTALYLVPLFAMLLHCFFQRRVAADIGLVDFSCLKPPRRLRVPVAKFIEHLKLSGHFNRGSVELMSKAIEASGMGNETYIPPALHCIPPAAAYADAIEEAHLLFFPTLDDLFAKTGVAPSDVGALVVNCSGFCPAPSLTAIIANHYRMLSDLKTFNLCGMGCSAGVIGVDVASSLLRSHPSMSCAVVVSAEIFASRFYSGNEHAKLLLHCYFRTGCSAALVTNTRGIGIGIAAAAPIKYRLVSLTRTNQIANDRSYRSGYLDEDEEGIAGFTVGQGVGRTVSEMLRAHLAALGLSILPWPEKLRCMAALLLSLRIRRCKLVASGVPTPDFRAAADHFCLPSNNRQIISRIGQGLGLGESEVEAALMTFHRFGNQSAASLWYQLAYLEAKGRVRKGDTVWQLGVGSGLKANSLVWQRVAGGRGGDGRGALGPWMDCIHYYPIKES